MVVYMGDTVNGVLAGFIDGVFFLDFLKNIRRLSDYSLFLSNLKSQIHRVASFHP